ncbi:MAG: hypothetical protein EOP37_28595 [Rubrivivax sp.]|nr:MAG: hypothetical protein EOP37_28595 [Rubrivivax sp.]
MEQLDGQRLAPGTLRLYLKNERPIRADQFSATIAAIANDYRRLSGGGELVVIEAHTGSIEVKLAAIVTVATLISGANDLYDLVGKVGGQLDRARHDGVRAQSRAMGARPATEIMKIAADSGSLVELDYSSAEGERLVVRITPQEAQRAVSNRVQPAASQRREAAKAVDDLPRALGAIDDAFMDRIIRDLKPRPDGSLSDHDLMMLDIAVEIIRRHGSNSAVADFANRLDKAGLHEEAEAVRAGLPSKPT